MFGWWWRLHDCSSCADSWCLWRARIMMHGFPCRKQLRLYAACFSMHLFRLFCLTLHISLYLLVLTDQGVQDQCLSDTNTMPVTKRPHAKHKTLSMSFQPELLGAAFTFSSTVRTFSLLLENLLQNKWVTNLEVQLSAHTSVKWKLGYCKHFSEVIPL